MARRILKIYHYISLPLTVFHTHSRLCTILIFAVVLTPPPLCLVKFCKLVHLMKLMQISLAIWLK